MKAENLFSLPAIDVLGAGIPGYDIALQIKRDQREVANGIEHAVRRRRSKRISGRRARRICRLTQKYESSSPNPRLRCMQL